MQTMNLTFNDIESALFALDLAEYEAKRNKWGLCYSLGQEEASRLDINIIKSLMDQWPESTGRRAFPVPGGREAFMKHDESWAMWSRFHPYGRARRRMVKWIRQQLEAELERLA